MNEIPYTESLAADISDVIIVGGGPAGLSAAMYAGRAGLRVRVIDKNPLAGALGMAERIENYPGAAAVSSGSQLLEIMRQQAERFGAELLRGQVIGVDLRHPVKQIMTASGTVSGRSVIFATGAMARGAPLPGEGELLGKGVSYCATCDAPFFRDKEVAVVGAEAAVDELPEICRFARKIFFLCPKKTLPADILSSVKQSSCVDVYLGVRVLNIQGQSRVSGITFVDERAQEQSRELSGVFMYLQGTKPVTDYLYGGVPLQDNGCIIVDREMATPMEGVFAAGDVTCKRFRQAIIASGEGCIAALSAIKFVSGGAGPARQWGGTA